MNETMAWVSALSALVAIYCAVKAENYARASIDFAAKVENLARQTNAGLARIIKAQNRAKEPRENHHP